MPHSHCEPILTAAVRKLALDRVAGLHDGLTEAGLAERNLLTQLSDIALHLVAEVADAVSQVGQPVIQLAELLAVEDLLLAGCRGILAVVVLLVLPFPLEDQEQDDDPPHTVPAAKAAVIIDGRPKIGEGVIVLCHSFV